MSDTKQDINYINLDNFQEVLDLVNSSDLSMPLPSSWVPPQDGCWYCRDTGESQPHLDSSFYCVDFETISETKTLVMGSAWDILNQQMWVMISEPYTNPRVETKGKLLIVAHRSTFELGFFREAYQIDCQIRFFDTHSIAVQKFHPGQTQFYRSSPDLKCFQESNDCSLKELSQKLLGINLDKNIVDVFIKAKDESWRVSRAVINEKAEKTIKKTFAYLTKKDQIEDVNLTWDKWLFEVCPSGLMSELPLDTWYKPSKRFLGLKKLWEITPEISELVLYNQNDVSATLGVFASMWEWYKDIEYDYIAGLYHRSIPFLPLSSDWFDKVSYIDSKYQQVLRQMVDLVDKIEIEYLETVGINDHDCFDWGVWGNGCTDKSKIGKYKWLGETGLSSKKLMRLSRLFWDGRPMFIVSESKIDKKGDVVVKKDGTDSQFSSWVTCEYDGESWLSSVKKALSGVELGSDCQWVQLARNGVEKLDNPTNTTKDFKDIVTVFSKTFLPFWESKRLTSESKYAQEISKLYSSISFWNSFRDRVYNKMSIYNNGSFMSLALRTQVSAAVSGRAIDNIGLVLSNPNKNKIGSEIGGHFTCPEGYKFVYADFDSIQAVIIALYAAIAEARRLGIARKPIDCLNNEFSRSVLVGEKKTKTTLAWLLAKQINPNWLLDWQVREQGELETIDEYLEYKNGKNKEIDNCYALGKTCQYALLFGVGLIKLEVICGSRMVAEDVLSYFKGVFNKERREYVGGIASGYFNYCKDLANGTQFIMGRFTRQEQMNSSFLGRPLPDILKVSNRGRDFSMTAQNVVTQAIDVDCLNYITNKIIELAGKEGIKVRYSTSVHDAIYFIVADEHCERVKEIFQEAHYLMYTRLLAAFNIDFDSFPAAGLKYSGVDINQRWTKAQGVLGKTLSNEDGYDYSILADLYEEQTREPLFAEDFVSNKDLKKQLYLAQKTGKLEIGDMVALSV